MKMYLNHHRSTQNVRMTVHESFQDTMPTSPVLVSEGYKIDCVTVTAPCTTANLGPGFDVFALALEAFRDTVRIQTSPGGVTLEIAGPYSAGVPADPELNTAGLVAKELLNRRVTDTGVKIRIEKGIPVGKGIGSSAASAAATAVGLNHMLRLQLTMNEIVQVSARGEIASSGSPHADNVAAAVLGGFTFVQSYSSFSAVGLSPPRALEVAIAIPDAPSPPKKTEVARAVLPERVPLGKVAHNVGGAASIIAGILSDDIALIGKGMVDAIVEPARAHLVPGYAEVKKAALEAGAEGVAISGAGPSMIAIVDNTKVRASSVAEAMRDAFELVGVESHAVASRPACGAVIIRE
jgi:homoserine kinase